MNVYPLTYESHLGNLQFGEIKNKTSMNIHVHNLCVDIFHIIWVNA